MTSRPRSAGIDLNLWIHNNWINTLFNAIASKQQDFFKRMKMWYRLLCVQNHALDAATWHMSNKFTCQLVASKVKLKKKKKPNAWDSRQKHCQSHIHLSAHPLETIAATFNVHVEVLTSACVAKQSFPFPGTHFYFLLSILLSDIDKASEASDMDQF